MPGLGKTRLSSVGIDLTPAGIRMLQLRLDAQRPFVTAAAAHDFGDRTGEQPDVALVAPIIRKMWKENGFAGRSILLAMPGDSVEVRTVRVAAGDKADAATTAVAEFRATHAANADEISVCAIDAGEVRQGNDVRREVMLVCAKQYAVDRLVEAWHAEGFEPAAIDFEPAAIYRGVERFVRRRADENEVHVLLDLGPTSSRAIIGRGRTLAFYRAIDLGDYELTESVARKLGITPDEAATLRRRTAGADPADRGPVRQAVIDAIRPQVEALGRELALCLRYFTVNFRGSKPARVRLTGVGAADESTRSILANALPVPVEVGRMLSNADLSAMRSSDRNGPLAAWSTAFGLALHGTKLTWPDLTGRSREAQAVQPTLSTQEAGRA